MGIKTVPQPPYSPDLAPCDFCLFPKLRDCRYETIEEMKEAVIEGYWHTYKRGLSWGLPEVVGTVQQVHCSRRRLLWRGLEFHVCTINKSVNTKKSGNLFHNPCMFKHVLLKTVDYFLFRIFKWRHSNLLVIFLLSGLRWWRRCTILIQVLLTISLVILRGCVWLFLAVRFYIYLECCCFFL